MNLASNDLEGSIDLNDNIFTLQAINLTDNRFTGMFPCLSNNSGLVYLDIRRNDFTSMASHCEYNNDSLRYFLVSFNPKLTQSFDDITYNMNNMTMLAMSMTSIYGTVSNNIFWDGGQYLGLYDSDIATDYKPIDSNVTWNQTWLVIGLTISGKLPSYVNDIEKQ